ALADQLSRHQKFKKDNMEVLLMTKSKDSEIMMWLGEAAKSGTISRRSFMNYSMAAGVGATAASGLWASKASAAPQKGGTFRVGVHDGNSSDTHDPGTYI